MVLRTLLVVTAAAAGGAANTSNAFVPVSSLHHRHHQQPPKTKIIGFGGLLQHENGGGLADSTRRNSGRLIARSLQKHDHRRPRIGGVVVLGGSTVETIEESSEAQKAEEEQHFPIRTDESSSSLSSEEEEEEEVEEQVQEHTFERISVCSTLPEHLTGRDITLPRHPTHEEANELLGETEMFLRSLHHASLISDEELTVAHDRETEDNMISSEDDKGHKATSQLVSAEEEDEEVEETDESSDSSLLNDAVEFFRQECDRRQDITGKEKVFANSYVDLGKIDTIGFDFDYTLVTYSIRLLSLIYDMALERLVNDKQYPVELLNLKGKFDAFFSIRGLAVDRETGWICHLSYTHKVAVAWEGREKVGSERLVNEYSGKRALRPNERKKRLKPLNDLFSMAECCLIADVLQYFKDKEIPYDPRSAVEDLLGAIGNTHISGDFHRLVASNPDKYFEPKPYLASVLQSLKESGKKLVFVSNSPFWYVDAGMNYVIGPNWRKQWDVVITSAGKPRFYVEDKRPFREVSVRTGRTKFKKIDRLEPGEVYSEGCLKEMTRCLQWEMEESTPPSELQSKINAGYSLTNPNVLYIGDSLFADLVDAKREFGWTTAAVTPEVAAELELQSQPKAVLAHQTIEVLVHTLRRVQEILGNNARTVEDGALLDQLEEMVSMWRDEQTYLMGNPFGSVFRARFQPSLFAHSLRRYSDLYMTGVESLRLYSPQHRFYPEDARLLGHELSRHSPECWNFGDL